MKKIIVPQRKEEAVYYSDFSGQCFGTFHPAITLTISFDYGSQFDGNRLEIHLTDKESLEVLDFLKTKLSNDYKTQLQNNIHNAETNYEDSVQSRDWQQCDYDYYTIQLNKFLLNTKT